MIETYILFGAAIFGIGWLLGNYTKDKEKADYTMFIIDSLIQNRFLRTHPIEILPKSIRETYYSLGYTKGTPEKPSEIGRISFSKELYKQFKIVYNISL